MNNDVKKQQYQFLQNYLNKTRQKAIGEKKPTNPTTASETQKDEDWLRA
jgi:hypothetical protein